MQCAGLAHCIPFPVAQNKNEREESRMKGAIIGDIIGSIYEFDNIKTKDFPLFGKKCFFTDDSVMTVAIADALLSTRGRDDDTIRDVMQMRMRRYGQTYPGRGYGGHFLDWLYQDDPKPYNSCGNGSAMRVSPVGFFANSEEECIRLATLSAQPSHNHPDGIRGAVATALCIYTALTTKDRDKVVEVCRRYYPYDFCLDEIRPEYYFGHFQALCAGTVPYAVQAFAESTSFEDAIRNVVSIGGDTDTLAAITGPIAEAYYGVPEELWETASGYLSEEIRDVVNRFYTEIEK